jgi:hypothetical protein
MLLPSLTQRVDVLVGIATPTVPLSCALATGTPNVKPSVMAAASALRVFLRAFMYLQFI